MSLPLRLQSALAKVRTDLLAERTLAGHWEGELSSSALSTATAVTAMALAEFGNSTLNSQIGTGLDWLASHANADGGWGDTVLSLSNISTTTLCWAAFGAVPGADEKYQATVQAARCWIERTIGERVTPGALAAAIIRRYGKDRTFSVPILTLCALAGRLGEGQEAWTEVMALPFELAAFPRSWFAALKLPVVSYALPALIAIGQARHVRSPSANPFARWIRQAVRGRTLEVLEEVQPTSGGFLEATPLTSFVVMSLAGSGQAHHPVARKGLEFLARSQRLDGSWAIDTNLATWVTTLAVNALATPPDVSSWLLNQQYRCVHPYTEAPPGGWAWTDLPGGVPDADDTAGALLALHRSRKVRPSQILESAAAGIIWLLNLQNRDGGIPTFCRGWGNLPFDRSSPDLTAHAMRAWATWRGELPALQPRIDRAIGRALEFLKQTQRGDGSWCPLWFGNQFAPEEENPTYGTSRVLLALVGESRAGEMLRRGVDWLVRAQREDGAWSGAAGAPASVEETAWALEGVASAWEAVPALRKIEPLRQSLSRGAEWLVGQVESDQWTTVAPVGFYFAKLWYYEKLYPRIFTVAALERAQRAMMSEVC